MNSAAPKHPGLGDAGAGFFAWQQGPSAFRSALQEVFRDLNSLHHGMIGVPDLVAPSTEAAARIDPLLGEPRMDGGQGPVAPDGGNRIGVGHAQQLAADDLGCSGVRSLLLPMSTLGTPSRCQEANIISREWAQTYGMIESWRFPHRRSRILKVVAALLSLDDAQNTLSDYASSAT